MAGALAKAERAAGAIEEPTGSLDFDPWEIATIPLDASCGCMCGGFRVVKRAIIDADVETSWRVAVLDWGKFPEWNPFHRQVETTLKVGTPYKVRLDMDLTNKPINELDVFESTISFVDHSQHILVYNSGSCYTASRRVQAMRSTADGKTEYLSVDSIGGCIGWLINCILRRKIERAFDAQVLALKRAAEQAAQAADG